MPFTINGTTGIDLGTQPLTGSLPDANAPSGSVIQVVQAVTTSLASTTGTTYVDTNLSCSITPLSASSNILIMVTHQGVRVSSNAYIFSRIVRNGTSIEQITQDHLWFGGQTFEREAGIAHSMIDSPSTISSVTYKTQFYCGGSGTVSLQNNSRPSRMILMEIAA
jgi:hypothetical protein